MGSNDRGSSSVFDTFRCLGTAFITFSFGMITVRVLTLDVVSLRAIATTLWLVPMINSNAANLVSASGALDVASNGVECFLYVLECGGVHASI